jgi:hypothetical protein
VVITPSNFQDLQEHIRQLKKRGHSGRVIARWSMEIEENDPKLQLWVAQMRLAGSERPSWEWEIKVDTSVSPVQSILWVRAFVPDGTIRTRDRIRFKWEEDAVQVDRTLRRWVMEASTDDEAAQCTKTLLESTKLDLGYFEIRATDEGPVR